MNRTLGSKKGEDPSWSIWAEPDYTQKRNAESSVGLGLRPYRAIHPNSYMPRRIPYRIPVHDRQKPFNASLDAAILIFNLTMEKPSTLRS